LRGAWIEIMCADRTQYASFRVAPPCGERGLKYTSRGGKKAF